MDPEAPIASARPAPPEEKRFHGWRLLGILALVMVTIAGVSALVDLWVIPR